MIVVLDDNRRAREAIERFLKWHLQQAKKKTKIRSLSNTEEAIRFIRNNNVELVISDMIREDKDSGITFMHNVRKFKKNIPFIFMTAGRMEEAYPGLKHDMERVDWIDKNDLHNPFQILFKKVDTALTENITVDSPVCVP